MLMIKKISFILLTVFFILLFSFCILEIFSRLLIGQRLIVHVEENGLYHFKPNQEGWYTHYLRTPKAKINNIGARGQDVQMNMLNRTKKYIFLGDSFTFGWELKDNETISNYFMEQNSLNHTNIINYGNGGFGIDHMFSTYSFYKSFFNEGDTFFVILIEGDFYRPITEYKTSFIKEIFWLVRKKSSFISWTWAIFRHFFTFTGKINNETLENEDTFGDINQKKLLNFKDLIFKNKQNLVYVFYEYNQSSYSNKADEFCKKNNLMCITNIYDFISIVRAKNKEVYSVDKGHPSSESNYEVAKGMVKFINKKGL